MAAYYRFLILYYLIRTVVSVVNDKSIPIWRRILPFVVLLAAIVAAVVLFTGVLGQRADSEALSLAEQTLRRSAVECYALEGVYPADVDYLYENYGVSVDRERYIVHYEYVASNLMPNITVLPIP